MKCGGLLAALALAAGCGKEQPQSPKPGTPSTVSADEVPFVVFMEGSVVIDRVGATVRVPAAVGSTVSSQTISSSDSSVVEVTSTGELRARSRGRATIRATGNPAQVLEVEVRDAAAAELHPAAPAPGAEAPPGRLSLRPTSADLRVGQVILFEVTTDGQRVQPQWRFEGPALLLQSAPSGFVATRVGKTRLCASATLEPACAVVVVSR
jgi:hypothetical protein